MSLDPTALHSIHLPLGIHICSPCQRSTDSQLLKASYEFRHQVFIERLNYGVYHQDNIEFDQFDRPNTIYLIKYYQQQILGLVRVNPTHLPYLIDTLWPQFVDDKNTLPHSPYIFESSRFSLANTLNTLLRRQIILELCTALLEYTLQQQGLGIITLTYHFMWRQLERLGAKPNYLGSVKKLANCPPVRIGIIEANKQKYQNFQQQLSLTTPIIIH